MSNSNVDASTLDSEGRCVILEFPAFVLLGLYCPANRDESRDDFRLGFLDLLDARVRNLVRMGKKVFVTGDINISREELDSAGWEEAMRKNGMEGFEYCSTPARRLFNQLLLDGKVIGERDEGREEPVLWDITRGFHPNRKGMYTCWETKVNARPGNFGGRIDYVLCSISMKNWFSDSNIQEGLLGSDHCPVYAEFHDEVEVDGAKKHLLDIMNPEGIFEGGKRVQEWSNKNLLPMSGRLIPEFDRRRSIRDMFTRIPSMSKEINTEVNSGSEKDMITPSLASPISFDAPTSTLACNGESPKKFPSITAPSPPKQTLGKRVAKTDNTLPPLKKAKSTLAQPAPGKGQQSLAGFFKPKVAPKDVVYGTNDTGTTETIKAVVSPRDTSAAPEAVRKDSVSTDDRPALPEDAALLSSDLPKPTIITSAISPMAPKQSWSALLRKPKSPLCEHDEPCKTMQTKKPGANCGRSFWMCARPLGPSGQKEKGTAWRCGTFIWSSEWTAIEREQREKENRKNG